MGKFYKIFFVFVFISSFFIVNNSNALSQSKVIQNDTNKYFEQRIFNIHDFKLFYKIKYLKYLIEANREQIKKSGVGIAEQYIFLSELYGTNVPFKLRVKINNIVDKILLEKDKINRTQKLMELYEKADNISKTTDNKQVLRAMKYLKIKIAVNF